MGSWKWKYKSSKKKLWIEQWQTEVNIQFNFEGRIDTVFQNGKKKKRKIWDVISRNIKLLHSKCGPFSSRIDIICLIRNAKSKASSRLIESESSF